MPAEPTAYVEVLTFAIRVMNAGKAYEDPWDWGCTAQSVGDGMVRLTMAKGCPTRDHIVAVCRALQAMQAGYTHIQFERWGRGRIRNRKHAIEDILNVAH